jgi:hypothetical protein
MLKKPERQTLLGQAMDMRRSPRRRDAADLEHVKSGLGRKRRQMFTVCIVVALSLLVMACIAVSVTAILSAR